MQVLQETVLILEYSEHAKVNIYIKTWYLIMNLFIPGSDCVLVLQAWVSATMMRQPNNIKPATAPLTIGIIGIIGTSGSEKRQKQLI